MKLWMTIMFNRPTSTVSRYLASRDTGPHNQTTPFPLGRLAYQLDKTHIARARHHCAPNAAGTALRTGLTAWTSLRITNLVHMTDLDLSSKWLFSHDNILNTHPYQTTSISRLSKYQRRYISIFFFDLRSHVNRTRIHIMSSVHVSCAKR